MNHPTGKATRADQRVAQMVKLEQQIESGQAPAAADATLVQLKREIDTYVEDLRQPPPADNFEFESDCGRVTALVKQFGREPSEMTVDSSPRGNSPGVAGKVAKADLPFTHLREYELLSKLGEGGMGAVYKARHTKLDKIVAIKVLPSERLRDESAVARFEREMRAVGKLEHPNIVRAMDAGEVDNMHFLVMEYVKGFDLSQLLKQVGPLPVADACELIRQAAVGLDEADDHGMVHRDIKPSNIMLCRSGSRRKPPVVKILDMGLALLSDAHGADAGLTTTGQMMGTLDYMAPEQGGDSKNVDIRADIYALGASLYRLLCGEVIYHGEKYQTPVQKMMALATQPAPPIQSRIDGIPDELAAVVHRMLEKEPAARYRTPEEVVHALSPFCQGANLGRLMAACDPEFADQASEAHSKTTPSFSSPDSNTLPSVMSPQFAAQAPPVIDTRAGATTAKKPDPRRKPASLAAGGRQMPPYLPVAIGGALGGLALIVAVAVFFFQTPNGTLRVEINDPAIEVSVKGTDIVIKGAEREDIKITPGEKTLTIKRGDFTFDTGKLVLKKGEVTTVKVELLDGKVQVVSAGGVIGSKEIAADDQESAEPAVAGANNGLAFSGKETFVKVDSLPFDGAKPHTIEAWVWAEKLEGNIVSWDKLKGKDTVFPRLNLTPGKSEEGAIFEADSYKGSKSDSAPPTKRWIHLAGVHDASGIRLYVDGKESSKNEVPLGLLASPPTRVLQIGGEMAWHGEFFGRLDEIRISQTARYTENFTPARRFESDKQTVVLYHFDEGTGDVLRDSSGNNRHGKIVGAKWVSAGEGNSTESPVAGGNNYLLFDGSANSQVTVPTLKVPGGPGPLCVEGYVTLNRVREDFYVDAFGFNYEFNVQHLPYPNRGWHLYGRMPEGNFAVESPPPVVAGVRQHLAAVRDGNQLRLYVNGKKVASGELKGNLKPGKAPFFIGPKVDGAIDEVRVSTAVRYTDNFTPVQRHEPDEHTLALYHFDEGSGDVLRDSSGNNHHGKIVAAEWAAADVATGDASLSSAPAGFALYCDDSQELGAEYSGKFKSRPKQLTVEGFFFLPDMDKHITEVLASIGTHHAGGTVMQGIVRRFDGPLGIWGAGNQQRGSVTPPIARPFHAAMVADGQQARLYIDGKLAYEMEDARELRGSQIKLGWHYRGWMRDVRISDTARYTADFTPAMRLEPDDRTIALYRCDEGAGKVLNDSSGNNYHARIVGAKWAPVRGED